MPPESVMPPRPTDPVSPKPVANPWAAVAAVYSPAVRPAPAHAVRRRASMSRLFRPARSSTIPPSVVPCPAGLCPPLRTASSSPCSRARRTTRDTSAVLRARTTAAGRRSIP